MMDLLRGLLSSKKAMVMILSLLAMGLAKLGWDVDGEQLYIFIAPVLAYLLATGLADKGKEAAAILAEASAVDPPEAD